MCSNSLYLPFQLFLYFIVGSDHTGSPEMEIVVEETTSVKECLNLMLEKSGLSGDNWHLRRIDWCYEAGEALSQENATLKELNVCRGDTLVITEGKLPPKGFLKIPIWWFKSSSPKKHREPAPDQVNGLTYQMDALQVSPARARGNPRYKIPTHLLNEMNAVNTELQKKRAECDSVNNGIDLHLHLSSCYTFHNGALHPALTWKESVVGLTIDRRKTLGDLRQSIFQMLESWEGDMILSIAKPLPAGLHLYQILDGDELTLDGIGLADGTDVFVWNGKEHRTG